MLDEGRCQMPAEESVSSAEAAGLRFVSDDSKGIARKRRGKAFQYVMPSSDETLHGFGRHTIFWMGGDLRHGRGSLVHGRFLSRAGREVLRYQARRWNVANKTAL